MKVSIINHIMDMMCGWAEFVDSENYKYKTKEFTEKLFTLYQKSGAPQNFKNKEEEKEWVLRFFLTDVFPVIFGED